jgi:hypothetical protein
MSKIALITPDRNDRPEFLEHCRFQMSRQTLKAGAHFIINYPEKESVIDIVPRIKKGIKIAIDEGFEYCFVIENDDYYPDNYIEKMMFWFNHLPALVLAGLLQTTYYSLQNKSWRVLSHPGRSSLFCTAFRISGLKDFKWPDNDLLYFDIHLWAYNCPKKIIILGHPPIGIKHGIGFCPGNYHNLIVNGKPAKNMHADNSLDWLKKRVRPESFEFYKKMMENEIN